MTIYSVGLSRSAAAIALGLLAAGALLVSGQMANAANILSVTITSGPSDPASPTGSATPTFEFTSSATSTPVTFSCDIDGSSEACTSPYTPSTPLAEGSHNLTVSVLDGDSDTGTSLARSFTVDLTPPVVTVPSDMSQEAGSVVTFSAGANDAVSGPLTPSCTPSSGSAFSIGTTTVTCSATDAAGNTGSATFDVGIFDGTPPDVTGLLFSPLNISLANQSGITVQFNASDSVGVVGVFPTLTDGSITVTPTSISTSTNLYTVVFDASTLADGNITANATAADAAGNVGTAAPAVIQKDATAPAAPSIQMNTSSTTLTNSATPSFSGTAENGASVALYDENSQLLGSATADPSNGSFTITLSSGLSHGSHTLGAIASDSFGNASATTTFTIRVDLVAPTLSVSGPSGYYKAGTSFVATVNFSEPVVLTNAMEILFGFGGNCTVPAFFMSTDTKECNGVVTIPAVGATDQNPATASSFSIQSGGFYADDAGNQGSLPPNSTLTGVVVDTTSPILTLTGGSTTFLTEGNSYTDAGVTASESVTLNVTNPVNTAVPGVYTVTYDATDAAGNAAVQISRTVNVLPSSGPASITFSTTANPDTTKTGVLSDSLDASRGGVLFSLPAGTSITGPSGWSGALTLPEATTTFGAPTLKPGAKLYSSIGAEIGSLDYELSLSRAARIAFPGKAGQYAGWSRGGNFTQMTTICAADDQATADAMAAGADCYMNSGSDMVLWTKHLTTFVAYYQATETPASGGGGGGGNGAPISLTPTPAALIPSAPQGEVLGATTLSYTFTRNLRIGSTGEDVTALQDLLFEQGYMQDEATGYFGTKTSAAVKLYQKANGIEQTGTVGPLTRASLNSTSSASASAPQGAPALSKTQADAILGLLASFGAEQSVIDNVRKALGY